MADEGSRLVDMLVSMTKGNMGSILGRVCPDGLKDRLIQAMEYANGASEIIQAIVQTKTTFYSAGFSCTIKPPNANRKDAWQKNIQEQMRQNKIAKIVEELTFDYCASDNCILQWLIEDNQIKYVWTLNPASVEYQISTQGETLKVDIPDTMKQNINAMDRKDRKETERVYPLKYVDAVRKGLKQVQLRNEDGEYWIVRTRGRRFTGLASPSMSAVFRDVFIREMLIGGDWAIAFFFKRVIEHVKVGESSNAQCDDPKQLYGSNADFKALQDQFKKIGETMRLYTDPTVTIEHIIPDPKVFSAEKFVSCEERIFRWGGTPDVLLIGKGDGFAQGSVGMNRFLSDGKRVREAVGDVMEDFFLHEEVATILRIPAGSEAQCEWDEQILKDKKQVLDELNAAFDRGGMDMETYDETLGYNFELILQRKEKQQEPEIKKLLVPSFEPRQGLLNEGGRPSEGKPQPSASKRPKPSNTRGTEELEEANA